ncbi:MAG TPA: SDR family NAD(P)-dependent oxidoreductase [Thermotogota bacterium]|nr:SDR family NAD(P)-dependent oxidoreductase [Thermotogota bacterium]HRW35610.1 SDR family NAD(P)-dependent oxidoreductase [Thermotogota bacterium]
MNKYFKQYQWSNIFTMLHNQKLDPEICTSDFKNRLVVITGATSGIGFETAKKYASHGADILSINRNEEKSKELCQTLTDLYGTDCSYIIADFSKLADVHNAANRLASLDRTIDVFIHNAGVFLTKKTFTADHLEKVFQTNYLSTFILNYLTKDKFMRQGNGRIIFVNSEAHRFAVWGIHLDDLGWNKHSYSGLKSYGVAKTAQLLSMIKLKECFSGTGVTINAMHPGNVKTNSGKNNGKFYKLHKNLLVDRMARPITIASESLYFLGVSKKVETISGRFFNLTTVEEPAPPALDREEAEKLWMLSLELGGLK